MPDGSQNYLLSLTHYRSDIYGTRIPFPKDGEKEAIKTELVDQNWDDVVDYELTSYFPDVPLSWGVPRTYINYNVNSKAPNGFDGFFFWPYLGYADPESWSIGDGIRPAGAHFPPIQVDWKKGRIKMVADFLPRWGPEMYWLFNSLDPIEIGEVNDLAFERFAQYQFASSTRPDMIIRRAYNQTGVPLVIQPGPKKLFTEEISISWHHASLESLVWDYKLELAALHEAPPTVVYFKDFSLREVPYADWPKWYPDQAWAYATFVSTEGTGYETNEAIYEWTTIEGAMIDVFDPSTYDEGRKSITGQLDYLYGRTSESPEKYYTKIRKGFRGEFADLRNARPLLYFSPIDRKLHIQKAVKGVWNLDGGSEIRYENLGGEYLNQMAACQKRRSSKVVVFCGGVFDSGRGRRHPDCQNPGFAGGLYDPPAHHDERMGAAHRAAGGQ